MKNARRLTEGAVLLAVFAILMLLNLYVPVLGLVIIWFLPLPFIYFSWKHDWKGIIVFLVASLGLSMIVGSFLALPMALIFGTTGIALGYLSQKNKSRTTILLVSSIVFLINLLIQYGIAVAFFKFNFVEEATTMLKKSFDMSFKIMDTVGNNAEADKLKEQLDSFISMVDTLMPSMFVISSFIFVFLLQLINFPILKRFGLTVSHWKAFREISLPKSILWYYLITVILSLVLNPETGSYLYLALWNLAYILQIILVIQGLSFVYFISYQKGWAKAVPILITVFLFILPLVLYIIRILGIIDLGFDLRKRLVKK
ncbi:YybS family protein [Neobacillus sp. D3-1R]|uniref:YybS family protein n=1 Tax=Neobacillus sp. D3-1R TaxID=3445778 RepID=UPI003F9FBF62